MDKQDDKLPFKTCDDLLRAVLAILPNAQIEEDNFGQIVIYTDLIQVEGTDDLRNATPEDFE